MQTERDRREYQRRYKSLHRAERREYDRLHPRPNRKIPRKQTDRIRECARARRANLRADVLRGYGSKCECCSETAPEFLALDHRFGGGMAERRKIGRRDNHEIYKRAKKEGFPNRYRLLCHNCNLALGFYGRCPHGMVFVPGQVTSEPESRPQLSFPEVTAN